MDLKSQEFRYEVNKRAFVKNIKQKAAFIVGSIPMFQTLVLSLSLYFGISMPAFIALHIAERTLPLGAPISFIKCTKTIVGIPFCVMSEVIDKTSSGVLKILKLPDTSLDRQSTIDVPSDVKLQDVFEDMLKI